jgi:hypothetical protein
VSSVDDKDAPHYAGLLRVLSGLDPWLARIDPVPGRPRPSPGSSLRADDKRVHPYELSHASWNSLIHAVDHLNCLRTLLRDAQVIHMYAPYSLVRSALENACATVWMLQPARRTDRLARRLRLAASDVRSNEQAKKLTGKVGPRSEAQRLEEIRSIASRSGVAEAEAVRKVGYGEIVRSAGSMPGPETVVIPLIWRMCSGIAHGDLWTTLQIAERVDLPDAPPGMGSFKVTANVKTLRYVATFATQMTALGWRLYDQRSSAPY